MVDNESTTVPLQNRIKYGVSERELRHVITLILEELIQRQNLYKISHGNLSTRTVMLSVPSGKPLTQASVSLGPNLDLAEVEDRANRSSEGFNPEQFSELSDLRALGAIIFQMVKRQDYPDPKLIPWPVSSDESWEKLQDSNFNWRKAAHFLLDPRLSLANYTLVSLMNEIQGNNKALLNSPALSESASSVDTNVVPSSKKPNIALYAAIGVVLVGAGVGAMLMKGRGNSAPVRSTSSLPAVSQNQTSSSSPSASAQPSPQETAPSASGGVAQPNKDSSSSKAEEDAAIREQQRQEEARLLAEREQSEREAQALAARQKLEEEARLAAEKIEQERLQKFAEQERQAEIDRQERLAVAEKQRQAELERQRAQAEQQRIAEQNRIAEQQRQAELERQRQAALAQSAPPRTTKVTLSQAEISEYDVKAAFISQIPDLVQWPNLGSSGSSFVIGVVGNNPFQGRLAQAFRGKMIQGRSVTVREVSNAADSSSCNLLFVARGEANDARGILRQIADQPILTIGEESSFLGQGGMFSFSMENNQIRFEANKRTIQKSPLRIDPKLLDLAR